MLASIPIYLYRSIDLSVYLSVYLSKHLFQVQEQSLVHICAPRPASRGGPQAYTSTPHFTHGAIVHPGAAGASGHKPCHCCWNAVSTRSGWDKKNRNLISSRCSDIDAFVTHTNEQIYAHYDALAQAAETVSNARLARMQTSFGLTYCSYSLLSCKTLRTFCKPMTHGYFDPAHVLLINGVVSWAIYDFFEKLHTLTKGRMSWETFRQYLCSMDWRIPLPAGRLRASKGTMKNSFSDERIRASRSSDHYKGSAGEHLMLYRVMLHFAVSVVTHVDGMQKAIQALSSMCMVVESFFAPQCLHAWVYNRCSEEMLKARVRDCFEHHFEAYGDAGGVKPKWHYMLHLVRPRCVGQRVRKATVLDARDQRIDNG